MYPALSLIHKSDNKVLFFVLKASLYERLNKNSPKTSSDQSYKTKSMNLIQL